MKFRLRQDLLLPQSTFAAGQDQAGKAYKFTLFEYVVKCYILNMKNLAIFCV